MRRKNAKKVCAFLLALMLAATLLPMTAFAAEGNGTEYYGVWIGGEQFSSEKLTIPGQTGTAVYDPDTKTLTLDNYTYIGDGLDADDWLSILIEISGDQTIVLKGENKIVSTCQCHPYCYGIYNGNGRITIIGANGKNDSLLLQTEGLQCSMGIFTYAQGISIENCKVAVKCENDIDTNVGMLLRGDSVFRNCQIDVFCAGARGTQNGIMAQSLNMESSTVTASAIGDVAVEAQINLFYPCGYAWKASESSAYSEGLFAYNGESYLAIKPTAYMATWTDGNGASYEKGFKPGEEITIPVSQFFEETFRKTGYTLTGWQGYTAGMTMPENAVSFTAVYAPNQYTVSFDPNGAEAIDPITVTYDNKYGTLPSSAITGLSGGNSNWYLVDKNGNVTDTSIKKLTKVTVAEDHTLFVKRSVLSPNVSIALEVPGGISNGYQYYIPGNSTRILTAQVANRNDEILNYTYQWYKDGSILAGETGATLTLAGNVADSGEYKVAVTATIRPDAGIAVTSGTASAEKSLQVKILHQANTVNYDPNGGTGGPVSNYTGGTTLTVSRDVPVRENYIFQGWNTKADGSGETFAGADTYTFQNDNGNGGCNLTLYAQWKGVDQTLTYQVDGEVFKTDKVPYGQDIRLPDVPEKEGYTGKWDHDGKNITADTVIHAVYTVKKYTVTFVDEKGIYKTVEVAHGEKVEMPAVPEKAGYTVRWEKVLDTVTGDVTVKAVYTPKDPTNPQTGINSHIMLWFVLLAVSGAGILGVSLSEHKRKVLSKQ